jgi:hypothetical protein
VHDNVRGAGKSEEEKKLILIGNKFLSVYGKSFPFFSFFLFSDISSFLVVRMFGKMIFGYVPGFGVNG